MHGVGMTRTHQQHTNNFYSNFKEELSKNWVIKWCHSYKYRFFANFWYLDFFSSRKQCGHGYFYFLHLPHELRWMVTDLWILMATQSRWTSFIAQDTCTWQYYMLWRHIAKAPEQPLPAADAQQCTHRHTVHAWVGAALSYVGTCLISLCCCMQVCMQGKLQPALSIPTAFLWESGQEVSPKAHVANWVICLLRLLYGPHHSAAWKLVKNHNIHS